MLSKKDMLAKIIEADDAYYNNNEPIMSDKEYDALRRKYETEYEEINIVSGNVKLKSFKHICNVNSLQKIRYDEKDKLKNKIKELTNNLIIEPKLDGLTIVAYGDKYITRGNGVEGEEILYFPKYINNSQYPVRGEAYLTEEDFLWINEQQEKKGLKKFANARNCASGILRRLEKSEYVDKISFIAYDLLGYDKAEETKLQYIKEHTNFNVVEYKYFSNIEEFNSIYEEFNTKYPIDGLVIKCNYDNSLAKFGSTTHHPNNAFAYKIEDMVVETILRNIEWQVGKNKLTPVGVFDKVEIEGSVIEKASLSNYSNIKKLDLMIGDIIAIEKRNMVIPYISKMVQHNNNSRPITIPTVCPCCGATLINNGVDIFCSNEECKGKLGQKITYMLSKKCLNAKGISISTIDKLIEYGKINKIWDIFEITYEDLIQLDKIGDKSANNMLNELDKCKEVSLDIFISACCVNGISFEIGKLLSEKYTYEEILNINNYEEFLNIKGIGETNAKKLVSEEFKKHFIMLKKYLSIKETKVLRGKKFAFTGKLNKPRKFYEQILNQHGDVLTDTINKDLYGLVIADINSTSSKAQKARKLGIRLLSEEEFLKLY